MKTKSKYIYTVREETPMAYYKFIMFTLIIGLFVRSITFFRLFSDTLYGFPFWYDLVTSIIQLVLAFAGLAGLNQMKWYGPLCYMGNFGLLLLDAIAMLALSIYYGLGQESEALGRILAVLIWLIPTWIYFRHRRLLFSPPPADDPRVSVQAPAPMSAEYYSNVSAMQDTQLQTDTYDNPPPPSGNIPYAPQPVSPDNYFNNLSANSTYSQSTWDSPQEQPPVTFCRKCGRKLLPDSVFCSYCGASTEV